MREFIKGGAVLGEVEEGDVHVVLVTGLDGLHLGPGEDAAWELGDRGQLGRLINRLKRDFA